MTICPHCGKAQNRPPGGVCFYCELYIPEPPKEETDD